MPHVLLGNLSLGEKKQESLQIKNGHRQRSLDLKETPLSRTMFPDVFGMNFNEGLDLSNLFRRMGSTCLAGSMQVALETSC